MSSGIQLILTQGVMSSSTPPRKVFPALKQAIAWTCSSDSSNGYRTQVTNQRKAADDLEIGALKRVRHKFGRHLADSAVGPPMGRARVKRKVHLMSSGGHGPAVLFGSYEYSLSLDNRLNVNFGDRYWKTGFASHHAPYYTEKPFFLCI
jgi:hypothetical protein